MAIEIFFFTVTSKICTFFAIFPSEIKFPYILQLFQFIRMADTCRLSIWPHVLRHVWRGALTTRYPVFEGFSIRIRWEMTGKALGEIRAAYPAGCCDGWFARFPAIFHAYDARIRPGEPPSAIDPCRSQRSPCQWRRVLTPASEAVSLRDSRMKVFFGDQRTSPRDDWWRTCCNHCRTNRIHYWSCALKKKSRCIY